MQTVVEDTDVLFLWSMLAVDIATEQDSNKLLQDIAVMWTKIRGHSHAAYLLEQYKAATKKQTKGAKGTRKSLKVRIFVRKHILTPMTSSFWNACIYLFICERLPFAPTYIASRWFKVQSFYHSYHVGIVMVLLYCWVVTVMK